MKKITKAAIAAAAGAVLLVGGAGTLAFWTDTQAGESVVIATGNLDLGTIADGSGWTLQQNATGVNPAQAASVAYTNQLLVPGDVLTKTVQVPVTLTGANIKANLSISSAATGDAALTTGADALTVQITNIGSVTGGTTSTANTNISAIQGTATQSIPVTFKVTLPWASSNLTKSTTANFLANYTLTQIPVATP